MPPATAHRRRPDDGARCHRAARSSTCCARSSTRSACPSCSSPTTCACSRRSRRSVVLADGRIVEQASVSTLLDCSRVAGRPGAAPGRDRDALASSSLASIHSLLRGHGLARTYPVQGHPCWSATSRSPPAGRQHRASTSAGYDIIGESRVRAVRRSCGCCSRFDAPTAGTLRFRRQTDDTTTTRANLHSLRRDAGIVFQDPYASLDPRVASKDASADRLRALGVEGDRRARVGKILVEIGLGPRWRTVPARVLQRPAPSASRSRRSPPAAAARRRRLALASTSRIAQILELLAARARMAWQPARLARHRGSSRTCADQVDHHEGQAHRRGADRGRCCLKPQVAHLGVCWRRSPAINSGPARAGTAPARCRGTTFASEHGAHVPFLTVPPGRIAAVRGPESRRAAAAARATLRGTRRSMRAPQPGAVDGRSGTLVGERRFLRPNRDDLRCPKIEPLHRGVPSTE